MQTVIESVMYVLVILFCWKLIFSARQAIEAGSRAANEHVQILYERDIASADSYDHSITRSLLWYLERPKLSSNGRFAVAVSYLIVSACCVTFLSYLYVFGLHVLWH